MGSDESEEDDDDHQKNSTRTNATSGQSVALSLLVLD